MFDPIAAGLRAVSVHSSGAAALAFVAGAASCVGPCVAPRFIAVTALASRESPHGAWKPVAAFLAGLIGTCASFGVLASLLAWTVSRASIVYSVAALTLAICGAMTLMRDVTSAHAACEQRAAAGAPFLLGASSALVLSPCCAPMVFGILAYTTAVGKPLYGCYLLACFAAGHALPLLGVALGARRLAAVFAEMRVRQAVNVVSGSLLLALAGFYGVLV